MNRAQIAIALPAWLVAEWALAAAPAAVTTAPLEVIAGGPLRVEAGRPVRLRLDIGDRERFWNRVRGVAHHLAPAAPVQPTPPATAPIDVHLVWMDRGADPLDVPFRDGVAQVDVAAGKARRASYALRWTDSGGAIAVRLPAAAEGYPVEIATPGASTVVAGTGSRDLVVFGEELPLEIEVADAHGVTGATVYHRSAAQSSFTTSPMTLGAGDPARGTWKAALPRPAGAEAAVDYFVEITNAAGTRTHYGSSSMPFRLHLPDPTSQP